MSTSYCRLCEESQDSRSSTQPLNIRSVCNPIWWALELQPMFQCSMCFGLFIKQAWFFNRKLHMKCWRWLECGREDPVAPMGSHSAEDPQARVWPPLPRLQLPLLPMHKPWKTLLQRFTSSAQGETQWLISSAWWQLGSMSTKVEQQGQWLSSTR